jgi:hypothetical protein
MRRSEAVVVGTNGRLNQRKKKLSCVKTLVSKACIFAGKMKRW